MDRIDRRRHRRRLRDRRGDLSAARAVRTSFGSGNTLKVSARADSLRIGDRLSVNVVGLERFSGRLVQYYAGNVGPDGDGVARQEAEARLGQGPPVDEVQVVAAVRQKPSPGDVMDCAGTVTSVTGERSKMELAPACLVLASPRG